MSMKHTYRFDWEEADEMSVVIHIDAEVLKPELAQEINKFMSGHADRLNECEGDIYRVVAQLFASYLMRWALENGGVYCPANGPRGPEYVRDVLEWVGEGWPPAEQCGVTIVSAYVNTPDFSTLTVTVVQP